MSPKIMSPNMTRSVAEKWFGALNVGNKEEALECIDENIVWINNLPDKGLSDIIPWVGEYHGRQAVIGSFVIWGQLANVTTYDLKKLVIDGDEALAVVHQVTEIKATGMYYDIEYIQRFRVADNRIVFWRAYWDTVKGIVPFRGNMCNRLIAAAMTGNQDEALKVLPFGGNPNTIDGATGQTVLMIAASRNHTEMVRTLLQFGADPNSLDSHAGTTALHKACQGGHLETVKILVDAGAWINVPAASTGHTALFEAIWFASADIVEYLLEHDARIELKTYYGFTIDDHINYAIKVNQSKRKQKELLRIRSLVECRRQRAAEREQWCTLINTVRSNDLSAVKEAISKGSPLEERYPIVGSFDDGHTALLIAARDGHADIVSVLIAAGADVNAIEPVFGAVPLHKATYKGHTEIVRLLVSAPKINLNYQSPSNGYAPLHDSLWHGFVNCAEVLIDAGARLDLIAYDGKLPIDIAIEQFGDMHPIVAKIRQKSSAKT